MKLASGKRLLLKVTTADPVLFLADLVSQGVSVWDFKMTSDLEAVFVINSVDYDIVSTMAERRGGDFGIISVSGFAEQLRVILKRPIFCICALMLVIATLFLPTRILFIQVEGADSGVKQQILETASECGIFFGAARRMIRSEKCKNYLLSEVPRLQWVGVNTRGCVAYINVRERVIKAESEANGSISGLSAITDGVIREMTVTSGSPTCKVGDVVRKGQTLVSAYVDCGLYLRAEPAQAEIYAETTRNVELIAPNRYLYRSGDLSAVKKYGLRIGKKVINLFKYSRILDTSCVKIYDELELTLCDGFALPISVVTYTFLYSSDLVTKQEDEGDFEWLSMSAENLLLDRMIAGSITGCNIHADMDGAVCHYYGQYDCYEMIAQPFNEEIVINHE